MKVLAAALLLFVGITNCQDAEFFDCPIIPQIPVYQFKNLNALQVAVLFNSTEDIETFLATGCDINYDQPYTITIETECANPLFKQLGLSCKREVIHSGYTALNLAVLFGTDETVKRLLQVPGIDVNAGSNYSSNPLSNAVGKGNLELVDLLVRAGADLNYKGGKDDSKFTMLINGIFSESVPVVKYLIQKGVNINELDERDYSAVGVAASQSLNDIVKVLVDAGADINQKQGEFKQTLIMLALHDDNTELVKYLIKKGVDVKAQATDGETALYLAAAYGNIEAADALLRAGADIDKESSIGFSPLFRAIQKKNTDMALYLISKGADVNSRDTRDFTPAYAAAEAGDLVSLKKLAEAGADLNVQGGGREWSPIMKAAFDGNIDIVRYLKSQGVDLDLTDSEGNTALDLAEQQYNTDVSNLLREK